jgi:hypothetical protein
LNRAMAGGNSILISHNAEIIRFSFDGTQGRESFGFAQNHESFDFTQDHELVEWLVEWRVSGPCL